MSQINSLIDQLDSILKNVDSLKRRELLLNRMNEKENENIHCFDCIGNCCTYESNSMQVDILQALEVYLYLFKNKRWDVDVLKINECIKEYRLDKFFGYANKTLRRYYTCPFFKGESCGCSISRSIKPYGCLAFNPNQPKIKKGEECFSELELLKSRDHQFREIEKKAMEEISKLLNISWSSLPLPVALIEIHQVVKFQQE